MTVPDLLAATTLIGLIAPLALIDYILERKANCHRFWFESHLRECSKAYLERVRYDRQLEHEIETFTEFWLYCKAEASQKRRRMAA